jgi:hypothetical protein
MVLCHDDVFVGRNCGHVVCVRDKIMGWLLLKIVYNIIKYNIILYYYEIVVVVCVVVVVAPRICYS